MNTRDSCTFLNSRSISSISNELNSQNISNPSIRQKHRHHCHATRSRSPSIHHWLQNNGIHISREAEETKLETLVSKRSSLHTHTHTHTQIKIVLSICSLRNIEVKHHREPTSSSWPLKVKTGTLLTLVIWLTILHNRDKCRMD